MAYLQLSLSERIGVAKKAITNSQNHEELSALVARRSYTAEKLAVGQGLLETAQEKHQIQIREYGEQFQATDSLGEALEIQKNDFTDLREISKVVFKNDRKSYKMMLLNQNLERSQAGSEVQMENTFTNILATPSIIEALTPFGYDETTIRAMFDELNAIPELKTIRDTEKNEAQQATRDRDAAMADLDMWMADFLTIARIALKQKPELMELLGDIVSN